MLVLNDHYFHFMCSRKASAMSQSRLRTRWKGSWLGSWTVESFSETGRKLAEKAAVRGGTKCVEMENYSKKSLSLFSAYSVLNTVSHFSTLSPQNYWCITVKLYCDALWFLVIPTSCAWSSPLPEFSSHPAPLCPVTTDTSSTLNCCAISLRGFIGPWWNILSPPILRAHHATYLSCFVCTIAYINSGVYFNLSSWLDSTLCGARFLSSFSHQCTPTAQ